MVMKYWLGMIGLSFLAIFGGFEAQTDEELPTIYELVSGHAEFALFAQAIEQDGTLIDLLDDPDAELTLFVPTDQTIRTWLKHAGHLPDRAFLERDDLTDMLKYAVVPMVIDYHVVLDYPYTYLMTLLDERGLLIQQVDETLPVYINFSRVDDRYFASNGVIYLLLDDLLIPPPPLFETSLALPIDQVTLVEFIAQADHLTVFSQLLEASPALHQRLSDDQPFTLFVPDDHALQIYLAENDLTLAQLTADQPRLTDFLKRHIIAGQVRHETLKAAVLLLEGMDFEILNSGLEGLLFSISQDGLTVNRVPFIAHNHQVLNGMVHVIDGVLE